MPCKFLRTGWCKPTPILNWLGLLLSETIKTWWGSNLKIVVSMETKVYILQLSNFIKPVLRLINMCKLFPFERKNVNIQICNTLRVFVILVYKLSNLGKIYKQSLPWKHDKQFLSILCIIDSLCLCISFHYVMITTFWWKGGEHILSNTFKHTWAEIFLYGICLCLSVHLWIFHISTTTKPILQPLTKLSTNHPEI